MKTLLPYPGDGVIYDLPADQYHRVAALSFSNSRQILRSPKHWYLAMTKDDDETRIASRVNGSALHTLVLEPHLFAQQYLVMDDMPSRNSLMYKAMAAHLQHQPAGIVVVDTDGKNRNSKVFKDAVKSNPDDALLVLAHEWQPFVDLVSQRDMPLGAQILSREEYSPLAKAADAVREHPIGEFFLENSKREVSIFWRDMETGVPCKCRLDILPDSQYLPDLKSTTDASAFAAHFRQRNYRAQAAHYQNAVWAAFGEKRPFVFVTAELSEPYGVMTYDIDNDTMERGREYMAMACEAFAQFMEVEADLTAQLEHLPNYAPVTQTLSHHY